MKSGREATISTTKVNLVSLVGSFIVMFILAGFYAAAWGLDIHIGRWDILAWSVVIIISAGVHEALHALGYILFGRAKLSDIKIGVFWRRLLAYAHCKRPLEVAAYKKSVALPNLVLGIIPYSLGLGTGTGLLATYGAFLLMTGLGDFMLLWRIRKLRDVLVMDHPTEVGCQIIDP